MKKHTAIIIDDEQLALKTLEWQVEEFCPNIEVLDCFTNPLDAHKYLLEKDIDVVFLDIDMPEMSGFEFLKLWEHIPFDVIFTTAYSEFAIKAFKVSAFDYLLKPIDEEELIATISKYSKEHIKDTKQDQLDILLQFMSNKSAYATRIALPTSEGIYMIDVSSITRLEADKNYTTIYSTSHAKIIVSKTLKYVEKTLDPNIFMRIHQTHTINLNYIEMYHRGRGGNVELKDGTIVPVSKYKKEELLLKIKG